MLVIAFETHLDTTTVVDSLHLHIVELLEALFPDSTVALPRMSRGYTSGQVADLTAIAEVDLQLVQVEVSTSLRVVVQH